MDFWYGTAKAVVGAYVSLFIQKIHVNGRENIPSGPKIIVANHALASDGFILPFVFKEKVHYLIQDDLFAVPIFGKILALADQIPVTPGHGLEALEKACEKLAEGGMVALFPEGKLNDGKQILRAYTGAARLTLASGAPILPVGFYTPPKFAHNIKSHYHGRATQGAWQIGGPSFVAIGNTWQPQFALSSVSESGYQYAKAVRKMTDDIMTRINTMVDQARAYAATWFPSIQSGNQTDG